MWEDMGTRRRRPTRYNDAIREAGLEGVRKVNPVVDGFTKSC